MSPIAILSPAYRNHYRTTFRLALPVSLNQVSHILVGLVDSIMVGQLGAVPLAAASLAMSVFSAVLVFGLGFSNGITPMVALADGRGNRTRCATLLSHSLLVNICIGLLFAAVFTFGSDILRMLNQPEEVVTLAVPYFEMLIFSLLPLLVYQTFKQFAEGLSVTKEAMYITMAANLANAVLNYIFIFGKLGMEPRGLIGAGEATLISRILMAVGMFIFVWRARRFRPYWLKFSLTRLKGMVMAKIIKLGTPIGFQMLFEVGAFSAAAVIIGTFGAEQLAAHQIAISLAAASYMLVNGLGAAATVRVGNQLGKRDMPNLRMAAYSSFIMGLVFMSVMAVLFILLKDILPTFFVDDMNVITIASSLLVVAAFFQLSDGTQVVALGVLRGLQDVRVPTFITLFAYWAVALPLGYVLADTYGMKATGIWVGLLFGLSITAVMLFYRFQKIADKIERTTKERRLERDEIAKASEGQ